MDKNEINADRLNDAIMHLTKTYQRATAEDITKAISLLRASLTPAANARTVRLDRIQVVPSTFLPTREPWLDAWLADPRSTNGYGGMRRKETLLMAGMPYAGKSHWLQWLTSRYALQGQDVLYVFGEDLMEDVRDNFKLAVQNNPTAIKHVYLVDMDGRFSVRDVEDVLEQLHSDGIKPMVVTLDHLDLMMPSQSHREDWRMAEETMTDLKFFAKHNNVIAMTASQRSLDKDQKGMGALYRSKTGKAGNTDVIMMINDVFYGVEYNISLEKARGRRLPIGTKMLRCDWSKMTITESTAY